LSAHRLEADGRLRIGIARAPVLGDAERLERAEEIGVLLARHYADEATEAKPGHRTCRHWRAPRQVIDQRLAVANLPPFLDTGQSIPQCQQPLAAKSGCVQLLLRSDGDLALIDCRWRLAAERDPVSSNDVNAHGWVS
jgi:hypothetical protein